MRAPRRPRLTSYQDALVRSVGVKPTTRWSQSLALNRVILTIHGQKRRTLGGHHHRVALSNLQESRKSPIRLAVWRAQPGPTSIDQTIERAEMPATKPKPQFRLPVPLGLKFPTRDFQ